MGATKQAMIEEAENACNGCGKPCGPQPLHGECGRCGEPLKFCSSECENENLCSDCSMA